MFQVLFSISNINDLNHHIHSWILIFNPRPRAHHLLRVAYKRNVKDLSRFQEQVTWMWSLNKHLLNWRQDSSVFSAWVNHHIFTLKQRRHSAGVSSLPLCLFNIIRVCVCLCLLYVCPALCHCLFVYSVTWGRVCWSWSCGSGGNRFSWAGTTGCPGWHHLNTRRHGYVRAPGGAPCYSASGPASASLTFPK